MEEQLRTSQLAFISKIISHTTHEFKNHLAIINESAGLMGDLLGMESEGKLPNQERYLKIINSINDRVAVASELALKLNRFGHRMDYPMSCFNLNDLLAEELKLLGRYAGQQQVELSTDFSATIPTVYNYTSVCQYIFYRCFEYLISRFEGHSRVLVVTVPAEEGLLVEISAEGTVKDGTYDLLDGVMQDCSYGLGKMHAELKSEKNEDNQEKLTLSLMSLSPNKCGDK